MRYVRELVHGLVTMPEEPTVFQSWACPMVYVCVLVAVVMLAGVESAGRIR